MWQGESYEDRRSEVDADEACRARGRTSTASTDRSVTSEGGGMAEAVEKARSPHPLSRFFERFDPDRLAEAFWPFGEESRIRVEQHVTDDALIVRAELPGIDPNKDVEITAGGGYLQLRAERRSEHKDDKGRTHSEFRYGAFARTLPLPSNVNADDITASYRDGILEVRVPLPPESKPEARRVPVQMT